MRRSVVVSLTALALIALVGALGTRLRPACPGRGSRPSRLAGESEQAGKTPDNLAARALGGRKTLGFSIRRRAAAQAKRSPRPAARGSTSAPTTSAAASPTSSSIPTQAEHDLRRRRGRRRLEEHRRGHDVHAGVAGRLPAGDRRARARLRRDALGGHGRGERLRRRHHLLRRRRLQVDGRRRRPGQNVGLTDSGMIGRIAVDPTNPHRCSSRPRGASTRPAASAASTARSTAASTGRRS